MLFLFLINASPASADARDGKAPERGSEQITDEKIRETVLKNVRIEIKPGTEGKLWKRKPVEQALSRLRAAWVQQHGSPGIAFLAFLKEDRQPTEIKLTAEQTTVKEMLDRLCEQAGLKLEIRNGLVAVRSPSIQINIPDSPFQDMVSGDIAKQLRSFSLPEVLFNKATLEDIARYLNEKSQQLEADYDIELAVDKAVADRKVRLVLRNVPMYVLLRCLCAKTNTSLLYVPKRRKIVFAEPGTRISKLSVVKRKNKTESIPSISGKTIDRKRSRRATNKFGIELGNPDWLFAKDEKVVFNDRPASFNLQLFFKAGVFKGPQGQKVQIPSEHRTIHTENAKVIRKVEMTPFPDGASFHIDIRPYEAGKQDLERGQLPIYQNKNWVAFVKHPPIDISGRTKIIALYKNSEYNFGETMIPEGQYTLKASVRLKLFFEGKAEPVATVATFTDQKKFSSSNKDEKLYYKSWLSFTGRIGNIPPKYRNKLPDKQWRKETALTALSKAREKGIEFGPRYCAFTYERWGEYEKAYKIMKNSEYSNPDRIDELGPRMKAGVLNHMKRISRKAGKPNPLENYEFHRESPPSEKKKEGVR